MNIIIPLCRWECFRIKCHRVSVAVWVQLWEDHSCSIFWCFTFYLKGFWVVWHGQDRFFSELFLHTFECILAFLGPIKSFVLSQKVIQRVRDVGEISNKSVVEISKNEESSNLFDSRGDRPILNSFQFWGVHKNFSFFDNHSQIFNLCLVKFTFWGFQVKVIVS